MKTNFLKILLLSLFLLPLGLQAQTHNGHKKKKTVNMHAADSKVMNFDLSYLKKDEDLDLDFDVSADASNYLLIIAVDKYTFWKPLHNAVKDANDVKKVLLEKYRFDLANVYELYNEQVTLENVRATFEKIKEKIAGNDNLLIYFSGHGFYDASFDEGYWIPYNGKVGQVSTYIPNTNVLKYIAAINSRHTFLIADACFSGSLFSEQNRGYIEKVEQIKSRWGLTSGNIEFVSDGKQGENSPFAHYLVKFLKENLKDRFPVSELIQYVKIAVSDNTSQTPIGNPLRNVGNEGGEMVFYLK
ncbi:MAG: caspase family protein [Cytophagales bacterium]|nr:MAG: caspase family protein [Cytophagales bacterium]